MKRLYFLSLMIMASVAMSAKTLIVYYSYTNNVERVVNELRGLIDADVLEIEPVVKGQDYAANNYAIGSAQISAIRNNPNDASSYPAIDPVSVNLADYNTVIIGAPLWWSQMAAPLQSFLFQYGHELAGKNIGLIVSSASSGISGVESDAHRLVPAGKFMSSSLWIRSSQTSNARTMLQNWLKAVDYEAIAGANSVVKENKSEKYTVYNLSGTRLLSDAETADGLPTGFYIVNGEKKFIHP